MTTLLIDIGNSRIKLTSSTQPFNISTLAHEDTHELLTLLSNDSINKMAIVCGRSASAQQVLTVLQQYAQTHSIKLHLIQVNSNILATNYKNPSQFGTDRFLNLLAAVSRYQHNFCVVSCGTAITLDFYTHQHIGGMILPGLMTSQQLLSEKTGLHHISRPISLLGHDTATSIGAGLYIGLQNLIYSSIQRIEQQYQVSFTPLFTGGDADSLYHSGKLIPTLLFEGMNAYLNHANPETL